MRLYVNTIFAILVVCLVSACKTTESLSPLDPAQICGGVLAKDVGLRLNSIEFQNAVLENDGIHFDLYAKVFNCLGKEVTNATLSIDSATNLTILSASGVSSGTIKANNYSSLLSLGSFNYDQVNNTGIVNLKMLSSAGVVTTYPITLTLTTLIPSFTVEMSNSYIENQLGVLKNTGIIDSGDTLFFKIKVTNLSVTKIKTMNSVVSASGTNASYVDVDAASKIASSLGGELTSLSNRTASVYTNIKVLSTFPKGQSADLLINLSDINNPNPWSAKTLTVNVSTALVTPSVSVSEFGSSALFNTGGVKCWGDNIDGQIGNETYTSLSTPAQVVGLTSGIVAITSGQYTRCALTNTGTVKCWGYGYHGERGDGASGSGGFHLNTPVNVVAEGYAAGDLSGVSAIAEGNMHACALMNDKRVNCWGHNGAGELGNGTTDDSNFPTPATISGVVGIAAGYSTTCAIMETTRAVKCWGYNSYGQLGDGNTTYDQSTPVDVVGLTNVTAIAAGHYHTCALLNTGAVKCWGGNSYGELGDGTTNDRLAPTSVSGLTSGVAALTAGDGYTCALLTSGGVKCWGANSSGQLGDLSNNKKLIPTQVNSLISGVISISAGYANTCAMLASGAVKCWGDNQYGEVGDGTLIERDKPTSVSGL